MFAPPRPVVRALVLAGCVSSLTSPTSAHAQEAGALAAPDEIDDPKVQRRLGTRIDLGSVAPVDVPAAAFVGGDSSAPPPGADVVVRPLPSTADAQPGYVPHMKLAYRLLPFAQIATTGKGSGADETFHVVSLDLYPISSRWRIGLSTQYGWESGTFRQGGDAFFAEALSIGGQMPGPKFTPFFEIVGALGFMQRSHHPGVLSTKASALAQLGLDVGTEVFLARYAYLSFALGYVHAANWWGRLADTSGAGSVQSMSIDTWTLKVGFGI